MSTPRKTRRNRTKQKPPRRTAPWLPLAAAGGLIAVVALVAAVLMTGTTEPPEVGEQAPSFSLSDASGNQVALQDVLAENQQVALVFYRGYG